MLNKHTKRHPCPMRMSVHEAAWCQCWSNAAAPCISVNCCTILHSPDQYVDLNTLSLLCTIVRLMPCTLMLNTWSNSPQYGLYWCRTSCQLLPHGSWSRRWLCPHSGSRLQSCVARWEKSTCGPSLSYGPMPVYLIRWAVVEETPVDKERRERVHSKCASILRMGGHTSVISDYTFVKLIDKCAALPLNLPLRSWSYNRWCWHLSIVWQTLHLQTSIVCVSTVHVLNCLCAHFLSCWCSFVLKHATVQFACSALLLSNLLAEMWIAEAESPATAPPDCQGKRCAISFIKCWTETKCYVCLQL